MQEFLFRFRRSFVLEAAMGIVLLHAPVLHAENLGESSPEISYFWSRDNKILEQLSDNPVEHNKPSVDDSQINKNDYTINFDNISFVEYIRFVSKITGLNFIFNEQDLPFTVTIISQDPVTPRNIMSTLIQLLRVHDLSILEEENSLLITPSKTVNQIATIVSSDLPEGPNGPVPIVTRVFRINNAKLLTVATIVKSMLSASSTLEVSPETNQMIVTDVTTNVDKISSLLASIDAPHSSLEIETYEAKHASPLDLVQLSMQLVDPFREGNTLMLIPQPGSNKIFIVSTAYLIEKVVNVFEDLDIVATYSIGQDSLNNIFLYQLHNLSYGDFSSALADMVDELDSHKAAPELINALTNVKWIKESYSMLFVGGKDTISKIKELIPSLDIKPTEQALKSNFFVYKLQNANEKQFESALDKLCENLEKAPTPDKALIESILSMNYIKETGSFVFTGNQSALQKLQEILPSIDATSATSSNFFIYRLQHAGRKELEKSLHQLVEDLEKSPIPDYGLIHIVQNMHYIRELHSLVFTGNDASLERLKTMLPSFDVPYLADGQIRSVIPYQFYVYAPKVRKGADLERALHDIGDNLKMSGLANATFLQTIEHMKWIPATHSLVFTGDEVSLKQVQELLLSLDVAQEFNHDGEVFLYKLKFISKEKLIKDLEALASDLDLKSFSDLNLHKAINNMKWIPDSQSVVFRSDTMTLNRLKDFLVNLDSAEHGSDQDVMSFSLYALKHCQGDLLIDKLKEVAKDLKESNIPNPALIHAIEHSRWVKDNNSILITGSPRAIEQVTKLIQEFDILGVSYELHSKGEKTAFYIYTPKNQTGHAIEASFKETSKNLEASGLIDPDLLATVKTMRFVESSNSLIFTGTPPTLEKVKELLLKFDALTPNEIKMQELNETTFLVYRVEHMSHDSLTKAIHTTIADLAHRGLINEHVVECLKTLKWIEETHSVLVTGSKETLQAVHQLLVQFDIPTVASTTAPTEPLNFIVYTPKSVPGPELIKALKDFKNSLLTSGITDAPLFAAIDQLKWIPRTSSLLISGQTSATKQIEELLTRFDTTSTYKGDGEAAPAAAENSNFLVYKLQYHQGDEILSALKKIAPEIAQTEPAQTQSLLKAINSLQWINVTNSLIASGDPASLTKIKTLVQNLDIPLRQVFIEILVIETNMTNNQNFGLQWGGKMQYLNRFGMGAGSFPIPGANINNQSNSSSVAPGAFQSSLSGINATTTPNANSMIPFFTGFDLGIIGDIIMHKGQSFISLGSLVNALQVDTDSTVVMNPKIITQDNRNSTIFVGQNVPFVGSLISSQSSFVQTNQNIEYRDIGFNLSITPTIGNSDIVTLDISNDISEVVGSPTQGTSSNNGNTQPTGILTSHTNMNTRVHVPDKHFVVLSGMIQESKTRFQTSIPCLGGLPVIGALFSENDHLDTKTNVIIFVRPHIINTYEEHKKVTSTQEAIYKEQAKIRILKEEFDEAVDLIKYPENE